MRGLTEKDTTGRGETINLRASRKQKTLIDRAAHSLGRSRSDFMLDTACREAESVLLDRRYFELSEDMFKRFTALLDKPPEDNPKLRRLLQTKAPWDSLNASLMIGAPQKLAPEHDVSAFDSGEPALDDWLRRRARLNEAGGASRTYVVCAGGRVAGYYTLAAGAIAHMEVPGRIRRNMPDAIPVVVLARLAVDKTCQGQGIGGGLLRDAVLRITQAAEIAGIRAILVHAISETAKQFYEKYGFVQSPVDPLTVIITVAEAARILASGT